MSEPRSIDSLQPERDIETLYHEIVEGAPASTNQRIDRLISKCLRGELAHCLHRGEITGYAGKPVRVMRFYSGPKSTVVVEGVNLTTQNAVNDTDALVGRLKRAAAGPRHNTASQSESIIAIVGYLATEKGLNGEAYLKKWIENTTSARAFDIEREKEAFRTAARNALSAAGNLR